MSLNGGDFLIAALGIGATAYALSCMNKDNQQIKENFEGMPKRAVEVQANANGSDIQIDYQQMLQNPPGYLQNALCSQSGNPTESYKSPGDLKNMRQQGVYGSSNFEANISPRFGPAEGYRGNIRYNMPAPGNMAVPKNPIQFGAMVEGYQCGGKNGCSGGSVKETMIPAVGKGQRQPVVTNQNALQQQDYLPVVNSLPAQTMNTLDAAGNQKQVIVQNRFMFANQKSRYNRDADSIRGDLPIIPRVGDWFVSSANPSTALRQGAMQVLGGKYNQTANALSNLKTAASGGANVDYSLVNQTPGKFNNTGTIQFSAFP